MLDAVVIGSGPNGLAAALALSMEGLSVRVYEASDTIGGGTRTRELTQPGFRHDVCSAIHPMAAVSPFFKRLPLEEHGLRWIQPDYPLAHPLDNHPAAILHKSIEKTAGKLGQDENAYLKLFEPIVNGWDKLAGEIMGPIPILPKHPILLAKFGLQAIRPADTLIQSTFSSQQGKALFAGLAAHSILPLDKMATSAVGLVLGAAGHHAGWPFPEGGSAAITKAMASYFESLGGEIITGHPVKDLSQLPEARTILFNTTPSQVLDIAKSAVSNGYAKKLKNYEYGAGIFKVDLAMEAPIPWSDSECSRAGTVHVGGTFEEIKESEAALKTNKHTDKPYVLVAQHSLFDETRAPNGKHTVWAYCHVPNGSTKDMTKPILNQIERFAPGFRELIIDMHTMNTQAMQNYNANYIGGDINGGKQDIRQLFTRPAGFVDPYHIPGTNMFISSSSAPPGGGVHGMCGYHAAKSAISRFFQ